MTEIELHALNAFLEQMQTERQALENFLLARKQSLVNDVTEQSLAVQAEEVLHALEDSVDVNVPPLEMAAPIAPLLEEDWRARRRIDAKRKSEVVIGGAMPLWDAFEQAVESGAAGQCCLDEECSSARAWKRSTRNVFVVGVLLSTLVLTTVAWTMLRARANAHQSPPATVSPLHSPTTPSSTTEHPPPGTP